MLHLRGSDADVELLIVHVEEGFFMCQFNLKAGQH